MSTLTPVSAESQKPSTTESVSTLATAGKILGVTLLSSGAAGGIVYALGGSPDLVAIVAAGVFIGLGLLAFCVSEYLKSRQFEVVNGESALSLEEAQKAVTKLYSPKSEFALFSMGDDQNKFAESDSTDLETDSAPVDGNKSDQEGLARQAVRTLHCGKFNPFLSGLQFTQLQQHEEPLVQIQAQIIQRQQQALETLQAIQSSGQVTQEQVDLVEKFNADIPALNSKRQGHRAAIDMTKSTVASGGMTPLDDLKECQEQAAQIQALDKEIERLGQETTRILKQRALEEAGVVLVDLGDPDESDVSIDDFLVIGRSPVKPQDSMEDFEDLGDVEPHDPEMDSWVRVDRRSPKNSTNMQGVPLSTIDAPPKGWVRWQEKELLKLETKRLRLQQDMMFKLKELKSLLHSMLDGSDSNQQASLKALMVDISGLIKELQENANAILTVKNQARNAGVEVLPDSQPCVVRDCLIQDAKTEIDALIEKIDAKIFNVEDEGFVSAIEFPPMKPAVAAH